eukprot:CAMPEP_0182588822 /NCGR_PEP_ID=MMETSP1324-20130603/68134_1 /TAXON_ID=236786 /ORGANISM="Florenciella sp., Strain RCC1587" /LENGTH=181 /DNA_ID=CAMNT_0024805929 /DNA_START=19 /DNA_END=561 /DNA_ORIENTATION=+
MYEDDYLFDTAFNFLYNRYDQRKRIINAMKEVVLLPRLELPIFDEVASLESNLEYLRYLMRSTHLWAVVTRGDEGTTLGISKSKLKERVKDVINIRRVTAMMGMDHGTTTERQATWEYWAQRGTWEQYDASNSATLERNFEQKNPTTLHATKKRGVVDFLADDTETSYTVDWDTMEQVHPK